MIADLAVDELFFIIGIYLSFGYLFSIFLHRFRIPNIVTYLLTGFILSNFVLHQEISTLELETPYMMIETLALGLIGFLIGTELKIKKLYTERVFVTVVLIAESGFTLLFVFSLTYFFSQNFLLALILGGLSTATAPAATVEIIKRLKAKGKMTERLQWILAFDDLSAIFIVYTIIVFVSVSIGGHFTLNHFIEGIWHELGIAILIGVSVGIIFDFIIERITDELQMMELTLGVLILVMATAHIIGTSVITTTMVIGAITTNLKGDNYEKAGDLLEVMMSPIIMVFFMFVGSNLKTTAFVPFPWLVLVYLIARTIGKFLGAYTGAVILKTDPRIRNNLGLGLLAQGGVALGLVSIAKDVLVSAGEEELGTTLVTIIVISTVFSEILGGIGTTMGIKRAGEAQIDETIVDLEGRSRDISLSHIP